MSHKRQTIRDYVVTQLGAVFSCTFNEMPFYPLSSAAAAGNGGYCVFTKEEEIEPMSMGTGSYERHLSLVLELYLKDKRDGYVPDTLDTAAELIELFFDTYSTLGGNAAACFLVGTEVDISGEADVPTGCLIMKYDVIYT